MVRLFLMSRIKTIAFSLFVFAIYFIHVLFNYHIDPASDQFTNVNLCPACFGDDLCPQFYHGEIKLTGVSRLKYLKSSKNVFTGRLLREHIILKKLAHDSEIEHIDKYICQMAKFHKVCEVNEAISALVRSYANISNHTQLISLMRSSVSSTDISHCPSDRLLSYILNKLYVSKRDFQEDKEVEFYKYGVMMYSSLLNPEAIILQVSVLTYLKTVFMNIVFWLYNQLPGTNKT